MGSRFAARLDPSTRLGLRLTFVVVAVFLVTIPFGVLLYEVMARGGMVNVDQEVAAHQDLENHVDGDRVLFAQVLTQFGSTALLASVVVLTVSYLAFRRRRRNAMFVLVTSVLGVIVNNTLKVMVGRSRPQFDDAVAHALGNSFPSGHAMNSAVVYGTLLVVMWRPLRTLRWRVTALSLLSGLVLAIAASRVVLTVHYVSDVVAGVVLGAAFVIGSAAAFRAWQDEGDQPHGQERAHHPRRTRSEASDTNQS